MKFNTQHLNDKGIKTVIEELTKRGITQVELKREGQKKILEVQSGDSLQTVKLRVRTKRKGNWHSTLSEAKQASDSQNHSANQPEQVYWVFIAFSSLTQFWIVPGSWLENDIYVAHQNYIARYNGHRAQNDRSTHHSIDENRLEQWKDRWDILGILPNS